MSATRYVAVSAAVVVALGVAIGVAPGIPRLSTNTPGILSGRGTTTDPLAMALTPDITTIVGTGSSGSALSAAPGFSAFTYWLFGDGSDGDCIWDGTTVVKGVTPVANRYVLTEFMFCDDATVSSGVDVSAGYPIYVYGTLTLAGHIERDGCTSTSAVNCSGDAVGFLPATTPGSSGAAGGLREHYEFNSGTTACGTSIAGGGVGNNGTDGPTGDSMGCGGVGGSICNAATAATGRAGGLKVNSPIAYRMGEQLVADGYGAFVGGFNFTLGASTGGGAGGNGANFLGVGGGGAAFVVVHARLIDDQGGSITADGGDGYTYTVTSQCMGGGAGGGGGIVTVVIGSGAFPTTSVSGGAGAPGTACVSGGCAGLHGGRGGDGVAGQKNLVNASAL